jgi:S-adenosylmethionine-diacylglycerol 3-amino-3-carboxypropyl transferase
VVMIASGGETLVPLARLPLARIHAVDMNVAQLALARLKLRLAGELSPEAICQLLGHEPMPSAERRCLLEDWFQTLGLEKDAFGPLDLVSELGPDHAGRYERCFAELRKVIASGCSREQALCGVMALPNLTALFGHEAAQNPRRPFHEHFAWRSELAFQRSDASTNPFLRQMYVGRFASGHHYDWLQSEAPPQTQVEWHHGRMVEVLSSMPAGSADLVHLSNILDWLSPDQATHTLEAAARVLKPGGRLILRQLNSSLEIASIATAIRWDLDLGRQMEARDRSFFYPHIHVGTLS